MAIKWDTEVLGNQHLFLQTNKVSGMGIKALCQSLSENDSSQFIWIRLLVLQWSGNSISSNSRLWSFSEITFCNQKYWQTNISLELHFNYFACSPVSNLFPVSLSFTWEYILTSAMSKQIKLSCEWIKYDQVSVAVLLQNQQTLI